MAKVVWHNDPEHPIKWFKLFFLHEEEEWIYANALVLLKRHRPRFFTQNNSYNERTIWDSYHSGIGVSNINLDRVNTELAKFGESEVSFPSTQGNLYSYLNKKDKISFRSELIEYLEGLDDDDRAKLVQAKIEEVRLIPVFEEPVRPDLFVRGSQRIYNGEAERRRAALFTHMAANGQSERGVPQTEPEPELVPIVAVSSVPSKAERMKELQDLRAHELDLRISLELPSPPKLTLAQLGDIDGALTEVRRRISILEEVALLVDRQNALLAQLDSPVDGSAPAVRTSVAGRDPRTMHEGAVPPV
jgi:hypothetical protein